MRSCPFSMHDLRIAQKAPESKIVTQIEPEFLMRSFSEFDGKRCLLKAEKMTDDTILTAVALILIVIAWWKKENLTIIVLVWMGALLLRNYAMYHLGNISAPLLLQLITDRISETFIYEHAMQQYAIVVAKLDVFGTAICMIVTTLYRKDHFRNIKVNLILFIAVILGVNFVNGYIDKPEFIILIVNAFNLLNLFLYTKELNKGEYR